MCSCGLETALCHLQLNRAIRYIPQALSRRRVRRESPTERRPDNGRTERTPPTPQSCFGRTAGHEATAGIMILASAMSHIVGRPAIRMEGGTINPMERLCPPPSASAFDSIVNTDNTAPPTGAKSVVILEYHVWKEEVPWLQNNRFWSAALLLKTDQP